MENFPIPAPEQTSTHLDTLVPERIHVSRQQQERIRMDGCEVVATGSVLVPHGRTVAIVPFPKSKTGFTIEIKIASSTAMDGRPSYKFEPDENTSTYRHSYLGYDAFFIPPALFATYRGRKVIGILSVSAASDKPRVWSLAYTLFYGTIQTRKH